MAVREAVSTSSLQPPQRKAPLVAAASELAPLTLEHLQPSPASIVPKAEDDELADELPPPPPPELQLRVTVWTMPALMIA